MVTTGLGLFGFIFGIGAYFEVEKLKKRVKELENRFKDAAE